MFVGLLTVQEDVNSSAADINVDFILNKIVHLVQTFHFK